MKRHLLLLFALFGIGFTPTTLGQQLGQFSQYMQNMYVLNPAAAGINHQVDINLSYRRQWTGISGAPTMFYLSGASPLGREYRKPSFKASSTRISNPEKYGGSAKATEERKSLYHGVGGMVASHEIGAFRKTLANGSYALHIPLNQKIMIGFGLSAGLSNYAFDASKIEADASTDQTYVNFISGGSSANVLDASFGTIIYNKRWYFAYSALQLLQNQIDFGTTNATGTELERHHYLSAGYTFDINSEFSLTPSVMVKNMAPLPVTYDINVKLDYQNFVWGGISYRNQSAIVGLFGMTLKEKYRFGYSYDYSVSTIREFATGSHEIFIGLMLNKREHIAF